MKKNLEKKLELQDIPLSKILIKNKTFMNREVLDVENLKKSIATEGQKIPVIFRKTPDGFQTISGFRRIEAAKELGLLTIKGIVYEQLSDKEAHKVSLIENLQRQSLLPWEEIKAYFMLTKEGFSITELGRIATRSKRTIQRYLLVAEKATDEFKKVLNNGQITVLQAYEAITRNIPIKKILGEKLSIRQMQRLASKSERSADIVRLKTFQNGNFNLIIHYKKDITDKDKVKKILAELLESLS